MTGRLDGQGGTCGSGNKCWDLDYGFGETVIIRTAHEDAATGHCVTFTGPLSAFRGNLQLDTVNLDWLRVYQFHDEASCQLRWPKPATEIQLAIRIKRETMPDSDYCRGNL